MTDAYEEFRPLLFSIAYRMLGSVSEAEDIVQEAFLRFHRKAVRYGDGGGKAPATPYPIRGRERLGLVLVGFAKQTRQMGLSVRPAEVNGQPGATVVDADDQIVYVVGLDIADGAVQAVRSIVNPDKLVHLRREAIRP